MEPTTYNLVFKETAPQVIKDCIEYFSTYVFKEINDKLNSSIVNVENLAEIKKNYFIAGGAVSSFITNQKIRDVDIYCSDSNTYRIISEALKSIGGNTPVASKNAEKFNLKNLPYSLDLIHTYFGTPQDILSSFDFTVCCALVKNNGFYHHPNYFIDLNNKKLVFNNSNQGLGVLRRTIKYIRKGYQIDAEAMLEAIKSIRNAEFNEGITKNFLEEGNRRLKDFHSFQFGNPANTTSNRQI